MTSLMRLTSTKRESSVRMVPKLLILEVVMTSDLSKLRIECIPFFSTFKNWNSGFLRFWEDKDSLEGRKTHVSLVADITCR